MRVGPGPEEPALPVGGGAGFAESLACMTRAHSMSHFQSSPFFGPTICLGVPLAASPDVRLSPPAGGTSSPLRFSVEGCGDVPPKELSSGEMQRRSSSLSPPSVLLLIVGPLPSSVPAYPRCLISYIIRQLCCKLQITSISKQKKVQHEEELEYLAELSPLAKWSEMLGWSARCSCQVHPFL